MSCPYCTPKVDPDTGESLGLCKEYCHADEPDDFLDVVSTRISLIHEYDGWFLRILMHSKHAGFVVTSIPDMPCCPFCGRRLT